MAVSQIEQLVSEYGYFIIFASMVLGLIGLPIPDEILLTVSGYFVRNGHLTYFLTIVVATLSSSLGMAISYTIGKYSGKLFTKRFQHRKAYTWAQKCIHRYGHFAVIFGYYIPGVRHMTSYITGIMGMPFKFYMINVVIGAFLWGNVFIGIGYFLGIME
ncbi:DedA family protein [Leuconostoc fallax]|uniref:DedA family protein n=1 Tax=Leuconostoc fallax TaxID=1251 RepID=UPI00208FFBF3|nr:DedA family protein [Leuconostoc fallax]MCO6184460.1 DedA family protein [Leuconostoc fallax]